MELTTLCYIEKEESYLMMHRIRKKKDVNKGKWIGVGGHFEEGESPEDCLRREVMEETGLSLRSWRFRGIVTFCFREDEETAAAMSRNVHIPVCEYMCLYTAEAEGDGDISAIDCVEGELAWMPKTELEKLDLWDGDRIFLRLLQEERPFFSLKLSYCGDRLEQAVLDGKELKL